jgi:glycosyltransferase involved in cell wall biosynthesis
MFANFRQYLGEWDIKVINTDKLNHQLEIEKVLKGLNFAFQTIQKMDPDYFSEILAEEQPGIVVFGHDGNPLDQLFVKAANTKGIPTLLVQDGVLAANKDVNPETAGIAARWKYWISSPIRTLSFFIRSNYSWRSKIEVALFELKYGNRGKNHIYGHGECRKIAVFGDAVKRMLLSEGIASERIVVTGNPKFDRIFYSGRENLKEKVCRKYHIPPEKDIILLLTQYFVEEGIWTPEQRKDFILAVAGASARLPDTQLIIKLHPPYENEEDYKLIVKGLAPEPVVCKYADLPELINACSLAITVNSTAGLEAMAMGKPVLIVDDHPYSLFSGSGALFAKTLNDISPAMQKALYDPQTREEMRKSISKFVFDQAYLQDGQASWRIADLIKNMVNNKSTVTV